MSILRPQPHALCLPATAKRDVRTQFGAVCWRLRRKKPEVLLVTTRRTRRWMVPKGWPMDGHTPAQAAAVEAFEEAGVEGQPNDHCIGFFSYLKIIEGEEALPCMVALFPVRVRKVHETWPEGDQRKRRWVSPRRAAELVQEPELQAILRRFDPAALPK